jgi:protein SCO1
MEVVGDMKTNRPNSNLQIWGRTSRRFPRTLIVLAFLVSLRFALAQATIAQIPDPIQNIGVRPQLLKQVGVDQKLGGSVPLNLTFRDETGRPVQLGQYFVARPVILSLVYYRCPMLCTQVLNGVERSLRGLSLDLGRDYEAVSVSIDPTERPLLASAKHELYTGMYGRPGGAQGWHFLTGDEPEIEALAKAVGFRYAYDPESKQFAHASVIMILTPEGKISKYFYGINYPSRELRLGLVDASEGRIGTPVDAVLLFCYHYDPATGKYGVIISHVLQIAGGITILALGGLILVLSRLEHYGLPGSRA